ncbi:MAG: M42 family metallopeptidase [Armatimonadota bacterium]
MNIELLKELVEGHGVPGQEDQIRAIVARELRGICELSTDAMGNLIAVKKGSGSGKKLMLAAHMDEIGFIVKFIDKDGFIRLQPLGGFDPRQLNSQRVIVHAEGGALNGVLMYGTKPKHMLTDAEANAGQNLDSFFVDCGLGEATKDSVKIGDMVTMSRQMISLGENLSCKAMDDRVCVFIMIEALKAAKSHDWDIYAVATVQEEIGLRGASAAGSGLVPDVVVALDVTLANDIPGVPEQDHVTKLGGGAAIKIMDGSLICHPKVVEHFRQLAIRNEIPHQMEVLPRGGTDAGGIQRLNGGVPAFTLSTPTRYIHTVNETVAKSDVQACIDILARYIEDVHNGDYVYGI